MSAPELNKKINISLAAIFGLVSSAFILGGVWYSFKANDERFITESVRVNQEIAGLRNDMNREIQLLRDETTKEDNYIRAEIKDVREDGLTRQGWINGRTDRKIINHEKIYHNKK